MIRLLPLLLVAGCASPVLPYQPDKMTAEQLRELIKDRSAAAACSVVVGPWGTARVVTINLDKGAAAPGTSVEIGQDCIAKMTGQK